MRLILRSCLRSPYLWTLIGTPLPPVNVLCAFALWLWTRSDRHGATRREASKCLNVQLSYTLIFLIPIAVAFGISLLDHTEGRQISAWFVFRLITGFPLGLISLAGILLLTLFNVRAFAFDVLRRPKPDIRRFRFVPEAGRSNQSDK